MLKQKHSKMKIVITGSLGHISKPLTEQLIEEGHQVTVISSNEAKAAEITALGATPAIGSLEDAGFLSATFVGADAVYCMVPPNNYFDHNLDLMAYFQLLGKNYATAIIASRVRRVVHLSSIGAHLQRGNGIIAGCYNVEAILRKLQDVTIITLRPTSFYYNLYAYMEPIRQSGVIRVNYGGKTKVPWVSPNDIAAVAVEELVSSTEGPKIRYNVSEDASGAETAAVLGAAIGKPDLKWELVSDEEVLQGLIGAGMNKEIAAGLVEMYASLENGPFVEDLNRNRPGAYGNVKLKDFAQEFAVVYAADGGSRH